MGGDFGPWNYVSMGLRVIYCFAPKLCRAKNKVIKTLRGKEWRLHNSAGQILKASFPAELWSLISLPRRVLDFLFLAPRSFRPMQPCPANSWRHIFRRQNNYQINLKIRYYYLFKGCIRKPLSFQRSIQLIRPLFRDKIFCWKLPLILKLKWNN